MNFAVLHYMQYILDFSVGFLFVPLVSVLFSRVSQLKFLWLATCSAIINSLQASRAVPHMMLLLSVYSASLPEHTT